MQSLKDSPISLAKRLREALDTWTPATDRPTQPMSEFETWLKEQQKRTLDQVEKQWSRDNIEAAICCLRHLHALREAKIPEAPPEKDGKRYVAGSWMLYELYNRLNESKEEDAAYVTGTELNGARTLNRFVEFDLKEQTSASFVADDESARDALVKIDERGYRLHAWFHTHPGKGPGATRPSGDAPKLDMNYQKRLEKGGHAAIGGIFSPDGYLRFFSHNQEFSTEVYGNGVSKEKENLYRLTEV